jgi:hypothetical protein
MVEPMATNQVVNQPASSESETGWVAGVLLYVIDRTGFGMIPARREARDACPAHTEGRDPWMSRIRDMHTKASLSCQRMEGRMLFQTWLQLHSPTTNVAVSLAKFSKLGHQVYGRWLAGSSYNSVLYQLEAVIRVYSHGAWKTFVPVRDWYE